MENIVEICVAIIIALFGLAYPIILDKTLNVGEKYKSTNIPQALSQECWNKKIIWNFNWFEIILYLSIISFIFLIFKIPASKFLEDYYVVRNSAKIITFGLTAVLIFVFIKWIILVRLYNENLPNLLDYLIKKYNKKTSNKNNDKKNTLFRAINDIAVYAVNTKDIDLQNKLYSFYVKYVVNSRKNEDDTTKYEDDFYDLVTRLVDECVENNYKHLFPLRDYAVNGSLLIPNDFQRTKISEQTYSRLWYNITLIRNNPNFIGRFWANSHQYFRFELEQIYPNSQWNENNELTITNEEEIEQRDLERKRFLEFHYALGGLLLYSQNYNGLKYLFTYSQSSPPKYVLLPYTMTDIFEWFEYFRNENNHLGNFIGFNKYRFPKLDSLGTENQVVYWICKYICILFIRQYKLLPTLYYQNTTKEPFLPDNIYSLYDWKNSLRYFGFCLESVLKDSRLLETIDLKETYEKKWKEINSFLLTLENDIDTKIKTLKLSAPLSKDKIRKFYASSSDIIAKGFNQYSRIMNNEYDEESEKDLELSLTGSMILYRKSAFIDNDKSCNKDTEFADSIVRGIIQRYIPNSFIISRTHRYLLNKDNILKGINKIIGDNDEACIVAFNLFSYKDALNKSKYKDKIIHLPSTDFTNTIFILRKQDLPKIEPLEISEAEKKLLKLDQPLVKEWNVYGKVIDINLPENKNIKEQYVDSSIENEENLQVLLALLFRTKIVFKADRNIIQININSEFEEQGPKNSLSDLKPL